VDFALLFPLFVGALGFGASGCLIGCMPVLSPVLASNALRDTGMKAWLASLALGRVAGYSFIAVLSFAGATYIKSLLGSGETISKFFGAFVILVSVALLVHAFYPFLHRCGVKNKSLMSPFGIGLGLSFSFCPAVLQLVSISGASSTLTLSLLCGVVFGVGVSAAPTLFYGFALYPLLKNGSLELMRYKKTLEIISALLLGIAGAAIFFGLLRI
jgi:hypothetical protein